MISYIKLYSEISPWDYFVRYGTFILFLIYPNIRNFDTFFQRYFNKRKHCLGNTCTKCIKRVLALSKGDLPYSPFFAGWMSFWEEDDSSLSHPPIFSFSLQKGYWIFWRHTFNLRQSSFPKLIHFTRRMIHPSKRASRRVNRVPWVDSQKILQWDLVKISERDSYHFAHRDLHKISLRDLVPRSLANLNRDL